MDDARDNNYLGKAAIGGVIGGLLSSIPLLNLLNCCFCLLNGVGAGAGVSMHLRSNPEAKMSIGESAISGAISGVIAAILATISGALTMLVMGKLMKGFYRDMGLPRDFVRQMTTLDAVGVLTSGCFNLVLYPAFGALFAILTLKLLHSNQSA